MAGRPVESLTAEIAAAAVPAFGDSHRGVDHRVANVSEERRTLATVTAPIGGQQLTATLRRRDGQDHATWETVLCIDDLDVLTGGYVGPLGEMADGERGPLISTDIEGDDGECWLVSAEGGRSTGEPAVQAGSQTWVDLGDDGYWAAITLTRSDA